MYQQILQGFCKNHICKAKHSMRLRGNDKGDVRRNTEEVVEVELLETDY